VRLLLLSIVGLELMHIIGIGEANLSFSLATMVVNFVMITTYVSLPNIVVVVVSK